jgi:hypothetical protein
VTWPECKWAALRYSRVGRKLDFGSPQDTQGCSTLWDAEKVEEVIDATDGSAEAVLGE